MHFSKPTSVVLGDRYASVSTICLFIVSISPKMEDILFLPTPSHIAPWMNFASLPPILSPIFPSLEQTLKGWGRDVERNTVFQNKPPSSALTYPLTISLMELNAEDHYWWTSVQIRQCRILLLLLFRMCSLASLGYILTALLWGLVKNKSPDWLMFISCVYLRILKASWQWYKMPLYVHGTNQGQSNKLHSELVRGQALQLFYSP